MKKIIIGGAGIVVAGAAAWLLLAGKTNAPKYLTEPVSRGEIVMSVSASGTVNPVTTVLVGTQISGKINALHADYNSQVKRGQLIAEIDPALLRSAMDQARANLANAVANLEKNRATLADAARTRDRYKDLFARNLVAKSDLDAAETSFETARATADGSRTQIDQTRAALKQAETNFLYTRIVSPVDGTVISRNVDVGQTVAASFQTPTLFTIAVDLTKMQIDTSVDEADIGGVAVGQDVEFTVDAWPDDTFKGKVFQVRNAAVVVQNVVTYDVVVQVANPELKLRPGMTANVSIISSRAQGVLRIPDAALRLALPGVGAPAGGRRPPEGGAARGPAVWVLRNGKPVHVQVQLGASDGTYTQLVAGDLRQGEEVIVETLGNSKAPAAAGPRMF